MNFKVDAQQFDALERVAEKAFRSGVCPPDVKNEDAAFMVMLAGAEMGLGPAQSLRCIGIVKGKLSFTADFTVALARRAPDCEYFKPVVGGDDKSVTYVTKRRGDPEPTTLTYTYAQAQRAGLVGSNTWKAHTEAMLRARCAAGLARAMYPDHVAGMYTPDEVEEAESDRGGTVETPSARPQPPATNTPDPLAPYRARVAAAQSSDELVAVVLALAPTVAQHRTDAWTAAQHRAADLDEHDLAAAIDRAKAITREPGAWTTVAAVLGEISVATTPAEVTEVVKRHAAAAGALPAPLKQALNNARGTRLAMLLPLADRFERKLRAAQDIPALDAVGEQLEQAAREQALTVEDATRLTALYNERAAAFEQDVAA